MLIAETRAIIEKKESNREEESNRRKIEIIINIQCLTLIVISYVLLKVVNILLFLFYYNLNYKNLTSKLDKNRKK